MNNFLIFIIISFNRERISTNYAKKAHTLHKSHKLIDCKPPKRFKLIQSDLVIYIVKSLVNLVFICDLKLQEYPPSLFIFLIIFYAALLRD